MEPYGEGVHECAPLDRSTQQVASVPNDPGTRFTRPISCWWCKKHVYFHTNGYGDTVLFDALGHPWQVHACWTDHVNERREQARRFLAEVTSEATSKVENLQRREYDLVQAGVHGDVIEVNGFVSAIYLTAVARSLHEQHEQGPKTLPGYVTVDVVNQRRVLFPFALPRDAGTKLAVYDTVKVVGRWGIRSGQPILLATSFSVPHYSTGVIREPIVWDSRRPTRSSEF